MQRMPLRCNRQRCDATGRAALRWQRHAGACADGPNGKTVVGESRSGKEPKREAPKRERARLSGKRASF